jgi:DNA-binding response OmpR family regulator
MIDSTNISNKSVLIVDDNSDIRFFLKSFLKAFKVNVHEAANGKDALALLNRIGKVDLVLLDIMMPVLDGFKTLKDIKSSDVLSNIKVALLTSKHDKNSVKKGIELGADDYIVKPIDNIILRKKLTILLNDSESMASLSTIKTDLFATIKNSPFKINMKITELSEFQIKIESPMELIEDSKLSLICPTLENKYGIDFELTCKIVSYEKNDLLFMSDAIFVGVKEADLEKIRRITIKGEGISDE